MAYPWPKKSDFSSQSWRVEEPSSKKRKVDDKDRGGRNQQPPKDDWDAGDDFTQDELDALDIVASQAIIQTQTFAAPEPPRTESLAASSCPGRTAGKRSTVFSSESSGSPDISSCISYSDQPDVSRAQVLSLQTKLEEQRKKAQEEKYYYMGENQSLKDKLHRQEEELELLRLQRDDRFDQQRQVDTEKMLKLQAQVTSLNSQSQFMERDNLNLQEKYRSLQQKLKELEQQQKQGGSPTNGQMLSSSSQRLSVSPRKVVVQPSPPSKQKQQELKELPGIGSDRKNFPTPQTFLQQISSPSVVPPSKPTCCSTSCQTAAFATRPPQSRRLQLGARRKTGSVGEVTGPQIVQHMLEGSPRVGWEENKDGRTRCDLGLASLLHDMSTSLQITSLTFSRDRESCCLTPVRPKGHRHRSGPAGLDLNEGTVHIISQQNLHLAVEGLALMLNGDQQGGYKNTLCDTLFNLSQKSSCASRLAQVSSALSSGAVMLLPLFTNYIQHYYDLVSSPGGKPARNLSGAQSSNSSGVSPRSLDSNSDSSFDSLSSQLRQLLQEGKVYAYNVEGYAITALSCLDSLLQLCPSVSRAVMASQHAPVTPVPTLQPLGETVLTSKKSSTSSGGVSDQKPSSSLEADDEHSTSSSEVRVIRMGGGSGRGLKNDTASICSSLFHLLLRLAGQDLEQSQQSNPETVKLALRVLTRLCQSCTMDDVQKMERILTQDILSNCFKQTRHKQVVVEAQRLLVSLARLDQLLPKLCAKSETCCLNAMHGACSMKGDGMFLVHKEYVNTLSRLLSEHKSGLQFVLKDTCHGLHKVVTSISMAAYHLFCLYRTTQPGHQAAILDTLAQCVVLIHSLAQEDAEFSRYHEPVQQQYVRVLSGLSRIFKGDPQSWEYHLTLLETLIDFELDSSDSSQNSEEDRMNQSSS